MSQPKFPDVKVSLIGRDGNAMSILSQTRKALRKAGHRREADQYMEEAMSGDYDHLLQTTMKYVEVR